jgi:hypothetical protein
MSVLVPAAATAQPDEKKDAVALTAVPSIRIGSTSFQNFVDENPIYRELYQRKSKRLQGLCKLANMRMRAMAAHVVDMSAKQEERTLKYIHYPSIEAATTDMQKTVQRCDLVPLSELEKKTISFAPNCLDTLLQLVRTYDRTSHMVLYICIDEPHGFGANFDHAKYGLPRTACHATYTHVSLMDKAIASTVPVPKRKHRMSVVSSDAIHSLSPNRLVCGHCLEEDTKEQHHKHCTPPCPQVYCSRDCQRADWVHHKLICLARGLHGGLRAPATPTEVV